MNDSCSMLDNTEIYYDSSYENVVSDSTMSVTVIRAPTTTFYIGFVTKVL